MGRQQGQGQGMGADLLASWTEQGDPDIPDHHSDMP